MLTLAMPTDSASHSGGPLPSGVRSLVVLVVLASNAAVFYDIFHHRCGLLSLLGIAGSVACVLAIELFHFRNKGFSHG